MRHDTPNETDTCLWVCQPSEPTGQHLSGIHPPGGRVQAEPPRRWHIDHPACIGPPLREWLQRWEAAMAARDDVSTDHADRQEATCPATSDGQDTGRLTQLHTGNPWRG